MEFSRGVQIHSRRRPNSSAALAFFFKQDWGTKTPHRLKQVLCKIKAKECKTGCLIKANKYHLDKQKYKILPFFVFSPNLPKIKYINSGYFFLLQRQQLLKSL